MKALFACEHTQALTKEARKYGIEAYSCDQLPASGGHPEWHYQCDVRELLDRDWGLLFAFPTCTYLTVSNNGPMARGCSLYTQEEAVILRKKAIEFFMLFADHPCKIKGIENPIGIMSSRYRKPDQIIQPYDFGEDASKKTCLWLTGLPLLKPTKRIPGRIINGKERWSNQTDSGQNNLSPNELRGHERSKTYLGIAAAMGGQWFKRLGLLYS